jgi:DNA modification methylase
MDKNETQETGVYDKRNKLNDLTGKEWLKLSGSFWVSEKCKDDKFAFQHPAPFLIKDIEKLILLFTKRNMVVLDPFNGIGTTTIASHNLDRKAIGIDLNKKYYEGTLERLKALSIDIDDSICLINGDSIEKIKTISDQVDYCVTSPPYHNILRNKGAGLRKESDDFRSGSRTGVEYYSDDKRDLGNQETYDDFLLLLKKVMHEVYYKLRKNAYTSIIISDFTINKKEVFVQADIVKIMQEIGFEFVGAIALAQNNKPLYPFGYPFQYKINHHHQNILNFRKQNE